MQNNSWVLKVVSLLVFSLVAPLFAFAQQASPQALPAPRVRITQAIDETQLTTLRGNTHPFARPEFDRGAAAPSMMLHRMLLVLNRAPEQETALQQFLVDLHDSSSPNFHKWLTPEQFGQQFGPADADIQTVSSWLQSHGFQIARVTKGRSIIEFSGTVVQMNQAFHTDIHKYVVNGEEHWANTNDPQIPAALAGVVAGPATLHNFVKKPHVQLSNRIGHGVKIPGKQPSITFSDNSHGVGPADFAKIYNVPNFLNPSLSPTFNGDGVVIAVVARSDINISDIQNFQNLFDAPTNLPTIIHDGPDPGNLGGGEEIEPVLDVTEAGSAAPHATVDLVVSQITETTDGVDLSEVFIIDNNLADDMTESFGLCEFLAGAAQARLEESIAEQATAQGISFFASTGDAGADGCDDPNAETVAQGPISVEVPAALPFTIAVGGSMFTANDSAFWSATNANNTLESALKYIPEDVWNESGTGANASIASGGGGASTIFGKPAFQTGFSGAPIDNQRDIPDVVLNAGAGHDPPVICVEDILNQFGQSCVPNAQGGFAVLPVGGTSASTPGFAGIMALVKQSTGTRQGLANFVLYKLFSAETTSPGLSMCNASTGNGPTSASCVFNDVTSGNNTVPNVPNASGFTASTGYDKASGLGSVNAANLISKWGSARSNQSTTTITSLSPTTLTHGQSVNVSISVAAKTGSGTPTGDVSLIASPIAGIGGPGGASTPAGITIAKFTLSSGNITSSTNTMPGGSYTVTAHYEGDGTFLPSDSVASAPITVAAENSQTQVQFVFVNPNTGAISVVNSEPYGANDLIRVNVTSTNASAPCAANTIGNFGCPTGAVTLTKNSTPLDAGTFALNSLGYTEDQAVFFTLSPGSYNLQAVYSGDASFKTSTGTDAITITAATTSASMTASPTSISSTGSTTLTATITTQSFGNAPTGMVTFKANGTTVATANVSPSVNANTGFAQATATLNVSASQLQTGSNSITATYNGDTNYAASPASAAVTVTVNGGTTGSFNLAASNVTVTSPGQSGTGTLQVTATGGFTGTISLSPSAFSGLPSLSSGSFNCASITLTATTTSGSCMFTISTMAPSALAPHSRPGGFGRWTPLGFSALLLLLWAALLRLRLNPRRRWAALAGLALAATLLAMGACGGGGHGGGSGGTPVGNDPNAKITLSSGSASNSVTFDVNVL